MRTHTLRLRLGLSFLAVLLLGMLLAGGLSWAAVEAMYRTTQAENLLAQARSLAASGLTQEAIDLSQGYVQTANALPGIHARLLDESGGVMLNLLTMQDELLPVPAAEQAQWVSAAELRLRAEVASALQGQAATAVRRVDGRRVVYAAAPVLDESGELGGVVYLAMPLPAGGLPWRTVVQLGAAGLFAALLAGAAGVLLAGRIARPVEEVTVAAEAVQAGNLQHAVLTEAGFAEGQRLAQAFNAMMARLQQAEQAKNAFIADVSHELRTPLTVIKGTVETLEDGALDDVEGRGPLLRGMQAETERLIRMVNELLVLTRAGAGNLHLDCERLNAGQVAQRRAEGLRKLAAARGVSIAVSAEAELWVWADVDRLAQVLDNLLDNALRYAPAGSVVQVRMWGEAERVWFAVQDDGPGIDAQHLPLVFERFYRVDGSRTRQTGGTGLGLAIVRSLVLAQGGQIEALSAPGHGTTMRFWLPKVAD